MARTRNLKPGFFQNEYLAELDPYARLLFAGLWTIADREGRLEDRPRKIKAAIFPYEDVDVDKLLDVLAECNEKFIYAYCINGKSYIQITNWQRHQNPHKNEAPSIIPAYDGTQEITRGNREITRGTREMDGRNPSLTLNSDYLNSDYLNSDNTEIEKSLDSIQFINDIQVFTDRPPATSAKMGTDDYRAAMNEIDRLIDEYGYDTVLETAKTVHEEERSWSVLQFEWQIRDRLKKIRPKGESGLRYLMEEGL